MIKQLIARDPNESNRTATTLELLFDLCFVVAIAQVASGLHHHLSDGHIARAVALYLMIFMALWWAWMNFTWFASGYDNDDSYYRIKVLIQMFGALVMAAGIHVAFEDHNFVILTAGYTIIRFGMVMMWLRAAKSNPEHSSMAHRYAIGLVFCQIAWIVLAFTHSTLWIYGWFACAIAELSVPVFAKRKRAATWHPRHISERYGLMIIIVIGESVTSSTLAIRSGLEDAGHFWAFAPIILAAPILLFSMWWLYFVNEGHFDHGSNRKTFIWGYIHYFIFAAAAAMGAGIGVSSDFYAHQSELSQTTMGLVIAIPVAVFVALVGIAQSQYSDRVKQLLPIYLVGGLACLASGFIPGQPLATAVVLAAITFLVNKRSIAD